MALTEQQLDALCGRAGSRWTCDACGYQTRGYYNNGDLLAVKRAHLASQHPEALPAWLVSAWRGSHGGAWPDGSWHVAAWQAWKPRAGQHPTAMSRWPAPTRKKDSNG